MNINIGDKVKISKHGLQFYANINKMIDCHTTPLRKEIRSDNVEELICELMAIHGVGTVKKMNSDGDLYIRWDYRLDGMKYYSEGVYEVESVSKMSILDKLKFKLQGRI